MKCLSLWQPWASAIALGFKKIETRDWQTRYTGPLAIHAAKRKITKEDLEYLKGYPYWEQLLALLPLQDMPYGCIVATCKLQVCLSTEDIYPSALVDEREAFWGNYEPGRYGWCLKDVHGLAMPIPFKGAQGLFDVPNALFTKAHPLPDVAPKAIGGLFE